MLKKIPSRGAVQAIAICLVLLFFQSIYAQESAMHFQFSLSQNPLIRRALLLCSASVVVIAAAALLYRFLRYYLANGQSHLKSDSNFLGDFVWFMITLALISLLFVPFFI